MMKTAVMISGLRALLVLADVSLAGVAARATDLTAEIQASYGLDTVDNELSYAALNPVTVDWTVNSASDAIARIEARCSNIVLLIQNNPDYTPTTDQCNSIARTYTTWVQSTKDNFEQIPRVADALRAANPTGAAHLASVLGSIPSTCGAAGSAIARICPSVAAEIDAETGAVQADAAQAIRDLQPGQPARLRRSAARQRATGTD